MANKTVTIKSADGDYTSLNAAFAGEDDINADLVTSEMILTFECWNFQDTANCTTGTGYTTSASYYLNVIGKVTDRTTTNMSLYSTDRYRLYVNGGGGLGLNITEDYTRINGIQINLHTYANLGLRIGAGWGQYSQNVVKCTEVNAGSYTCLGIIIEGLGAGSGQKIWNNFFYDGDYGINDGSEDQITPVYNNTIRDCGIGILGHSRAMLVLKNNCVQGCTTDYSGYFHADSEYNNDEDATAPATGRVTGTVTFAAADDCRLSVDDTVVRGEGVDLSTDGDGYHSFSDDIDGIARVAWDIGADEYVGAGGESPVPIIMQNMNQFNGGMAC